MIVLGINQVPGMLAWQHDSAAAIVKDGKIAAAAEEERFNRTRHFRGYPKSAVEFCLKSAGVALKDVDVIAVSYNPYAFLSRLSPNLRPKNLAQDIFNLGVFSHWKRQMKNQTGAKVVFIDHHLAHAASAYRCSGFGEANILTVDGSGETESFAFFTGKNGEIKKIWDIPFGSLFSRKKPYSIGFVYTRLTNFLNLGVHGEGKTMGLASYGKPEYDFSEILNIKSHNDFKINRENISRLYGRLERKNPEGSIEAEHENLAASLQSALEDSVVNLAREAYEHSGIKNFAFAGGVALNCNANSRVLAEDFCDGIFIQPAANDAGAALGAALEASFIYKRKPVGEKMANAYLGPSFSNEEIKKALDESKATHSYFEDIESETAKLLAEGKIVGWFQGAMEIGPRALGNRSILADPTAEGMNDKVNKFVKHREVWRPFAPSVAEESASKYFEGVGKAKESPFMLQTFFVKEEFRKTFPAITHIDGSSRIQTVREDQNPRFYKLLKEFGKIKGHPMVLNTSFNDKGEPIVCSPKDALRCFFSTGLDALVIGNYAVKK